MEWPQLGRANGPLWTKKGFNRGSWRENTTVLIHWWCDVDWRSLEWSWVDGSLKIVDTGVFVPCKCVLKQALHYLKLERLHLCARMCSGYLRVLSKQCVAANSTSSKNLSNLLHSKYPMFLNFLLGSLRICDDLGIPGQATRRTYQGTCHWCQLRHRVAHQLPRGFDWKKKRMSRGWELCLACLAFWWCGLVESCGQSVFFMSMIPWYTLVCVCVLVVCSSLFDLFFSFVMSRVVGKSCCFVQFNVINASFNATLHWSSCRF